MADSGSYHHGDLRAALLEAATIEIERTGYEELSLRKLAVAAGVSHGAPYRHFKSRESLLLEVAIRGAAQLEARYQTASVSNLGARGRLKAICRANLSLAFDQPQLFRLMFVSDVVKMKDASRALTGAFILFRTAVAATLDSDDAERIDQATLATWAALHGLALLRMSGRFERFKRSGKSDEVLIESVLESIIQPSVSANLQTSS